MRGEPRYEASAREEGGARFVGAPLAWHGALAAAPGLTTALEQAWRVREAGFPPVITFSRPGGTLPISLTGESCPLGCAHCGGHYLRHMATLEEALAGKTERARSATSFLVSGGCVAATGRVPFMDHLSDLAKLRRRGRLNFHVGLVGEEEARALEGLADAVSFDVVGHDDTIRQVLRLDRTVDDYRASLAALRRHVRVVPHVLAGLHGGRLLGERQAIEAAAAAGCGELVFLVLIPTRGTDFAGVTPPSVVDVAGLLAFARVRLPLARLGLGCMRPGGRYRTLLDPLAVRAGLQSIVQPAPAAADEALHLGLAIEETQECCVL